MKNLLRVKTLSSFVGYFISSFNPQILKTTLDDDDDDDDDDELFLWSGWPTKSV